MILASTFVLSAVCLLFFIHSGNIKRAGELTAIVHHAIAAVIAAYAVWLSWDRVFTEAVLGSNERFPLVITLQHFNIGYFIYDMAHVLAYDHGFILHHIVCLIGLCVPDYFQIAGLGNAVNVALAESGSLMYNYYSHKKTLKNYKLFVSVYAFTRVILLIWSVEVFRQLYLYEPGNFKQIPVWVVNVLGASQALLILLNIQFLYSHSSKLLKLIQATKTSAK